MKLKDYIGKYVPQINDEIKNLFDENTKETKNEFLKNYYTEMKDYFLAGGKRIRPLLSIATYNGFSETRDEKILRPSIGVEFLHNASLIHDDIIDNDDYRRGSPSFHYRYNQYHQNTKMNLLTPEEFGRDMGILGGDSAFFLGLQPLMYNQFDNVLNLRTVKLYEEVFRELVNGVIIEIDMVNQNELKIEDYIEMVKLKTGALIEKSVLIGANYARTDNSLEKLLSKYALNIGIIFQIRDDILGTFGNEKQTGKPVDSDIKEGKKTCLLIHAQNELTGKDKKRLNELIGRGDLDQNQVEEVRSIFRDCGAFDYSNQLVENYQNEAMNALEQLSSNISAEEKELFEDLLGFVSKRDF